MNTSSAATDGGYVLVVDDNCSFRQAVCQALDDEGYAYAAAADGLQALDRIAERHPAVILLDMRMPNMSGWEFAKAYRERYGSRAKIVTMSAAQDIVSWAQQINADAYLSKPFDFVQMYAIVERYGALAATAPPD